MAMFGRLAGADGDSGAMVGLLIFGLIFLLVGMIIGVRRSWDTNPHCLRVGALVVFVLSFFHIAVGIVAVIAAKILAKIWK